MESTSSNDATTEGPDTQEPNRRSFDIQSRLSLTEDERHIYFQEIQKHLKIGNADEVSKKQLDVLKTRSFIFKAFVESLMERSNRNEVKVMTYLVRVRKNSIENLKENEDSTEES